MFRFERQELSEGSGVGFACERLVRFQDVDAAGAVFHPRIIEYCHDCFADFLTTLGLPLERVLRAGLWGCPVAHTEADYFRALGCGDRIEVALVRAEVGGSDVVLGYRVRRLGDGVVVAVVQTRHVFVSHGERVEVPAELRAGLQAINP